MTRPFDKAGWIFEPKLDGYRMLVTQDAGTATLTSRNGNDLTPTFPEIARAARALPVPRAVLDGELVVLDPKGRPSFQALQKRARLGRALDVRRAAAESPAVYYAFDLLGFEDRDLRGLGTVQRKEVLRMLLPPLGPIRYLEHFDRDGLTLMQHATTLGFEGVVGKNADSPYRAGRSAQWIKVRAEQSEEFVVVGFTRPKGSRGGFGALQLGDYVEGELVYAGRAGSGFSEKQLGELREEFEALVRKTPACNGPRFWPSEDGPRAKRPIPGAKDTTWMEPRIVCEVRFKEWTEEGLLRQPVFLRFRDDKKPEECVRKGSDGAGAPEAADDPPAPKVARAPKEVPFTNLKKVFWPKEGYTKGDLIEYYRSLWPWMEPYLKDRPLVLTRYPDGIEGKSFYQKDAPDFVPEWIRKVPIWSEDTQRDIHYIVCDSIEALLYVANLGAIPLHIWASRASESGTARLVHRGPRSQERPVQRRGQGRAGGPRALRRDRAAPLHQDQRSERAARADPAGPADDLRSVPDPGRGDRPAGGGGAARYLDHHPADQGQGREGVPRLPPEPARPAPGDTFQCPADPWGARFRCRCSGRK